MTEQWQPIETAPKDGTGFLWHIQTWPGFRAIGAGHFDQSRNVFVVTDFWGDNDIVIDPTHWMPLPEPPK